LLELSGALKTGAPDTRKIASEMTLGEIDQRLEALGEPGVSGD
jgi:hypothetical protein